MQDFVIRAVDPMQSLEGVIAIAAASTGGMTTFNSAFVSAVRLRAKAEYDQGNKGLADKLNMAATFLSGHGDVDRSITEMTAEDLDIRDTDLPTIKECLFDLVRSVDFKTEEPHTSI